jgi:peptidoglycan/xylan/chitin deacetylase (PgdA/CDA1 family)/glycosyltransferase involved in cell wall biosynthesis
MVELSVIIPTYNRAERLRACLEALTRQKQLAADFEVVVVVDGSTDETMAMLHDFDAPYLLRPIWQENSGQPGALNRGIEEANGRFCLFVDDDIVAAPQLVAEHLRLQQAQEKVVGIGQLTLSLPDSAGWYARAFAQGWQAHYDWLNQETAELSWEDCYSGNLSAPREILLACGGFATDLPRSYDVELAYRLQKAGCTFVYLPAAVGCQDERKGFRQLSQDAQKAGMVDVILYRRDPNMLSQALASFPTGSWRKLLLRRLLLALHVSPRLLHLAGRFIKKPQRRYSWHSLVQNLCYWRGVRQAAGEDLWAQLTGGTPILMYHAVGAAGERASPFVMPTSRFAEHMAWLKRLGYQVITLDQYLACRRERRLPPAGSVIITFDDGYLDNYAHAYPLLHQHNFPATIFLVSGYVGQANQWDEGSELAGRPLLDWSQIKEMAKQGVQFGAHTCTHPSLTAVSPTQAAAEITGSREELAGKLGQPVNSFAYPYGEHNPAVQATVAAAGFAVACTVDPGLNSLTTPAAALRRVEIQGADSIVRLWLALWLGDAEAFWPRKRKK